MKKIILFISFILFIEISIFSETPEKYVRNKYGRNAVFYNEDTSDWLDDNKIGSQSSIFFFNSTNHDVTFEFHEIKTKMGNVTSDKIFPIKGRTKKITIKPNQYFDTITTLGDIEHFAFIFENEKSTIYTYADKINVVKETNTEGLVIDGFGTVSSSTEYYYSVVFEFADD